MTYWRSKNRRCAAVLSFDVDGESGILAIASFNGGIGVSLLTPP